MALYIIFFSCLHLRQYPYTVTLLSSEILVISLLQSGHRISTFFMFLIWFSRLIVRLFDYSELFCIIILLFSDIVNTFFQKNGLITSIFAPAKLSMYSTSIANPSGTSSFLFFPSIVNLVRKPIIFL